MPLFVYQFCYATHVTLATGPINELNQLNRQILIEKLFQGNLIQL